MTNEWILYAVSLIAILIAAFLFLLQSRQQGQLHQILQEKEQFAQEKHKLEQWVIQYKAQNESMQTLLSERSQYLQQLQQKLREAEEKEDVMELQLNQLNEKMGAAQATSQNWAEQWQQGQQQLHLKSRENEQLYQKLAESRQELSELRVSMQEKQANFEEQQRQFVSVRQQMTHEFQHLAQQIFEEKSRSFTHTNQSSLDLLLKPLKEQLDAFQKRVNEVHSEALKGNAELGAELKRVLDIGLSMSQEAQNLTTALKGNNKVMGNWGEVQLETALQNVGLLAGEHYEAQANYKDDHGQRFAPDFVVHLPDHKHLILDSKVSLLAYDQAVRSENELAVKQALDEHCRSLRAHIDGLSKKNYAHLIGIKSPDFVLMFVPIEPAYIEAMKHDPQLFHYGYERNVILVSHTTLMPILRTVANLWRIERGNSEAREISEKAGEIYNQVCLIAERLSKVGAALNNATNQYNQTVTALVGNRGLLGKVERFQSLSNKANQTVPQVDLLENEADTLRLSLVSEKNSAETESLQ